MPLCNVQLVSEVATQPDIRKTHNMQVNNQMLFSESFLSELWPMKRSAPLQIYMTNYKQRQGSELAESTYGVSHKVEISKRIENSLDKNERPKFKWKTCRWNGDTWKMLDERKMARATLSCRKWGFFIIRLFQIYEQNIHQIKNMLKQSIPSPEDQLD